MGEGTRAASARLVALRPAALRDLDRVTAIERACFSDPWSAHALAAAITGAQTTVMVAEVDGPGGAEVLGYFVLSRAGEEAELLNLAVDSGHRRRGLGVALLNQALVEARMHGARAVFLEVRASNIAARSLYQSAGFETVGRRKNYYKRPAEDALILRRVLLASQ